MLYFIFCSDFEEVRKKQDALVADQSSTFFEISNFDLDYLPADRYFEQFQFYYF